MRFYDKINTTIDLHKLDDKSRQQNKACVGITKGGDLYTVDGSKSHRKINIAEAAEILETTSEEVQKLLDARGDYQIKDPEPVVPEIIPSPVVAPEVTEPAMESPKVEKPEQSKDPVQEAAGIIAKAVGEVLGEHEAKTKEQIDRIEGKVDKLQESVDKLQTEVENFYL